MVSVIGDIYKDKWQPYVSPPLPNPYPAPISIRPHVTREEFEALRREVLALKELLEAAKKFDERTGQPDCEMQSKIEILRAVAKAVGVDLDSVFKKEVKEDGSEEAFLATCD